MTGRRDAFRSFLTQLANPDRPATTLRRRYPLG